MCIGCLKTDQIKAAKIRLSRLRFLLVVAVKAHLTMDSKAVSGSFTRSFDPSSIHLLIVAGLQKPRCSPTK